MSARRGQRGGLRRLWERARTEPGLGRNLVVIAVLFAIGTLFAGYFLSHQRFNPPWEDKRSIYATFEESPAISPGNGQEVRIAGVEVGDIRSASVSGDGKARIEMKIDNRYPVHRNARVVLRPKSPLNEMYIELSPGGPPAEKVPANGTLPVSNSQRPIQFDELFGKLDGDTRAALTSLLSEADVALARAPKDLPKGLRGGSKVLGDLQPVATELGKRRESLGRLVTALSQISNATGRNDARLSRLAGSLRRTLNTVAGGDDSLDAALGRLPELSDKLRSATGQVTELSGQLDPTLDGVKRASGQLPGALNRFNQSVGALDRTVDAARPVLANARPVVADMRPAVRDLNSSLGNVGPVTGKLDTVTSGLLPYLTDLQGFVYNTNSATSLTDANRGILRGQVNITPESLPLKALDSPLGG